MAKKILNGISTALVIVVVILAVLLVGVRVFGYRPFAILSPSMTPTYGVGDLVYVRATAAEEIAVGDALTFVADANLTVVTHRVVEIGKDGRTYYTQGDANEIRDGGAVSYENVIGVVAFSLPKLGYVSFFLTTTAGKWTAGACLCVLVLLFLLPDCFAKRKKSAPPSDGARGN